jgi:signal transduction histidine kinase/type II secretory pathway pseudopilin PulG
MEVAPEPIDVGRRERTFGWASLVGVVARVPLAIRAKQLVGSLVVAALLALVAVLGLIALGQSNSRGTELRRLQEQGVYEQLLLTDATQLKQLIDTRLGPGSNERPFRSDEPDLRAFDPASYQRGYLSAEDQQIGREFNRLCLDAGAGAEAAHCLGDPGSTIGGAPPHLPLTLRAVAPSLYRKFEGVAVPLSEPTGEPLVTPKSAFNDVSLFFMVSGASGYPQAPYRPFFVRADNWAASFAEKLAVLTGKTRARADALVAADRRSYNHSRDLLIGAGAGSLLLALALGLLLSDSVLVPLRKTQRRLAAIAAGDFAGHVEVPNRDEIGALAADVNRMSDELQRLYGELETASRHKSDFLATMSHELRTPLNAIIGFSEVLHEQMFGELNERQLAYVDDVLEAGKHLLSLINDVLDLAKIEAGGMELELSEVAIPEVLRSAVSMHSERASRGGVELSLTTEPEEITISADGRRVRQIVFNLVSNAVKFTPAEGRVDVSARLDDGQVELAVADTGPGIAPEELELIFEEFKQATDGKRAEGTGLGLPLSRKLVELHGGRLWVESAAGNGSTFRFTLPVGPTEPASVRPN